MTTTGQPARAAALELRELTKAFGDFVADDHVSLRVEHGEIHALVGENGAGKTTLMNMCFGMLQPTSGEILVEGERVAVTDPAVARRHGIGMVHQHFKLVPSLTVAENVFLGDELLTRHRSLDQKRMVADLAEVSARYGLLVDPRKRVDELSASMRQRVEILKALYFDAKVLVLDEPTAVLTPQESEGLFEVLRELADSDRAAILITHKLQEVKAVSDRFTVLRRGRWITTDSTSRFSERQIAELMVGREVSLSRTESIPASRAAAPVVLTCADLVVPDNSGRSAVDGVSFDLRAGEITGIAGVEGNGQTELVEALAGLLPVAAGRVELGQRTITHASPANRRALGLAHVPEDRLAAGISVTSSVQDNVAGGYLRSNLFAVGLLRGRLLAAWVGQLIKHYDVRGTDPTTPAGALSGGNMQKVVIARELESDPEVLLAAQPTRGVDIGATEFVHRQLREHRDRGAGILLVSADLGELLAVCDRILVIYRGKIIGAFAPDESLIPQIGLAMAGVLEPGADTMPTEPVEHTRVDLAVRARRRIDVSKYSGERSVSTSFDARPRRRDAFRWDALVAGFSQSTIAVAIALAIGMAIIVGLGDNPFTAYHSLITGSFTSRNSVSGLIAQVTPVLLVAVSVYVSFRAGVLNIGAEGQMYVGGFTGTLIALYTGSLPGWLIIVLSVCGGAVGGAIWGLVPGLLNAYARVDILVTTLMFNYIGIQLTTYFVDGPFKDPTAGVPSTNQIPASAHLGSILGPGGGNIGIFIGIVALVVAAVAILRTRWGLEARFVGDNRIFARYLGIDVRHKVLQVMMISGAAAGIAGVVAALGTQYAFTTTFSPGYGFMGLTVALLGRLRPAGIAVAALFYGALEYGSSIMQLNTNVPLSLVNVLEGIIIVLMTASALAIHRRTRGRSVNPEPAVGAAQGADKAREVTG